CRLQLATTVADDGQRPEIILNGANPLLGVDETKALRDYVSRLSMARSPNQPFSTRSAVDITYGLSLLLRSQTGQGNLVDRIVTKPDPNALRRESVIYSCSQVLEPLMNQAATWVQQQQWQSGLCLRLRAEQVRLEFAQGSTQAARAKAGALMKLASQG